MLLMNKQESVNKVILTDFLQLNQDSGYIISTH